MSEKVLAKAQLIAFDVSPGPSQQAKAGSSAGSESMSVQFNPATLVVSLSTSLENGTGTGGTREVPSQFVEKASSTLSVDLEFDTTHDGSDVRENTRWIADRFLKPGEAQGGKPPAPKKCRFQWGTFEFEGMVKTYTETLDFFSSEGVPLRARLALTLSEERFQFKILPRSAHGQSQIAAVAPDQPVHEAGSVAGQDPRDWRQTALFNGIESPRFPGATALAVPEPGSVQQSIAAAGAGPTTGFAVGSSDVLGTAIRGAFPDVQVR